MEKLRILISGGSIAGLTAAYWLDYNNFDVTIVEKAESIRSGGYPIDIRGTAIDVMKKMKLHETLKKEDLNGMKLTFWKEDGTQEGEIIDAVKNNEDIEVPRGELTHLLYSKVKDKNINFYFNDSITELIELENGVSVHFKSGKKEKYDIVVGADGVHSNTRKLVFGPEENYAKYLGYWFTGFTMKNRKNLFKEGIIHSEAGRTAVLYGKKSPDEITAFLIHYDEKPPFINHRDEKKQKELVMDHFYDMGSITPEILEAMQDADDLYFDVTNQIIMNVWSKEKIVLLGDAAYSASFITGQGTSLAIVGAYILSNALAEQNDIKTAFSSYEEKLKPFVEKNQNRVNKDSFHFAYPKDEKDLSKRNSMLNSMQQKQPFQEETTNDIAQIPRYLD